jgi:hypothetical protein
MNNIFYIYFHRDFDGICSAALFAEIIRDILSLERDSFQFQAVDYDRKSKWLSDTLKKPNAVLDFLYHPDATWWFDHHTSAFPDYKTKRQYKNGPHHFWDTSFGSCPSLIKYHFLKKLPLLSSSNLATFDEWIHWSDKIDSADYTSPREPIEIEHPCLQINATLSIDYSRDYLEFLINQIRGKTPLEIASQRSVHSKFLKYKKNRDTELEILKNLLEVRDSSVAYFDQSQYDIPFQRYASYYFFPSVNYTIGVYKRGHGYSISVGKNPWKNFVSENIGNICKRYGGGGRKDVGAIITDNHEEASRISMNILKMLLRHDKEDEHNPKEVNDPVK